MQRRCLSGFSVRWVTNHLISPVKIRIFCPKTTKFGPKLAFLFSFGQALSAYSVPCCWVGWWLWRGGCISQDTYLLYDNRWTIEITRHYLFGEKNSAITNLPREAGVVVHAEIVETKSPKRTNIIHFLKERKNISFVDKKRLIALLPQLLPTYMYM